MSNELTPEQQAAAAEAARRAKLKAEFEAQEGFSDDCNLELGGKMELVFQVQEAAFTTDANYNEGKSTILKLIGIDEETGEEHKEYWSVGANFEGANNGQSLVYNGKPLPNGKQKGLNVNSRLGMIIARFREMDYGVDAAREMVGRGAPSLREASSWVGTRWQMGPVEIQGFASKGETAKAEVKRFPVEFLGRVGKPLGQGAATAPAPVASVLPATTSPVGVVPATAAPVVTQAAPLAALPATSPVGVLPGLGQTAAVTPSPLTQVANTAPLAAQVTALASTLPPAAAPASALIQSIPPEHLPGLKLLAMSNADNNGFLTQAMANPAYQPILANPAIMQQVIAGQLFLELRG